MKSSRLILAALVNRSTSFVIASAKGVCNTRSASTLASATEKMTFASRAIDRVILSKAQSEGVGAVVRRSIGTHQLRNFDPFLMLDEMVQVGPPAGFPDHPHRGFETVTYMLKGAFSHEDFCGHKGTIESGDLQWMTAGRGILHSEMPATEGESSGLQLWVNLAAKDKMCEPAYQELKARDIPVAKGDGVEVIVIAGTALGVTSRVYTRTPTSYLHFKMQPNSKVEQAIQPEWNCFLYTLSGEVVVGDADKPIGPHHTITLTRGGDGVTLSTKDSPADFMLIGGQPLNEPIVQHGPFVMNTQEEIMQAMRDYQNGKNGFEKARGWYSEIGLPITHADRR